MKPTWAALSPILQGAEVDEEAAWNVVLAHHDFVLGVVRRVVPRAVDLVEAQGGDVERVVTAAYLWVVGRLVHRAADDHEGLVVPPHAPDAEGGATKWLYRTVARLLRDHVKVERRRRRRVRRIPSGDVRPPVVWDEADERKLRRLVEHPDRAGVPETHVLAYVCVYRPDVLTRSMVDVAAAYVPTAGSRSGRPGVLRPVDVAWALLVDWRARHATDFGSPAARLELAWILRSDDPGPVETWRDREPELARTATVTLGKWAIRCADALTLPRRT